MSSHLVIGLADIILKWCGDTPEEQERNMCKMLRLFPDHSFLCSAKYASDALMTILTREVGPERMYLDSGGYTLFKFSKRVTEGTATQDEYLKRCRAAHKRFMYFASKYKFGEIFELDNEMYQVNDDLLSPENFCRNDIKEITGSYPTPVFKMDQGMQYWKALCDSPLYPKLAVGGLAATRSWGSKKMELKVMMDYARQKGKKVHLLGCSNVATFKLAKPDTVDYCVLQFAVNIALVRKDYPDEKEFKNLRKPMISTMFARAKARSFLYDSFMKEVEEYEETPDERTVSSAVDSIIKSEERETALENILECSIETPCAGVTDDW